MKRCVIPFLLCILSVSCDTKVTIDENKINENGAKLQKTVEKGADTLVSKVKRLAKSADTSRP